MNPKDMIRYLFYSCGCVTTEVINTLVCTLTGYQISISVCVLAMLPHAVRPTCPRCLPPFALFMQGSTTAPPCHAKED